MDNPTPQSRPPRRRTTLAQAREGLARAQADEWAWKALHTMLRRIVEAIIRGERL